MATTYKLGRVCPICGAKIHDKNKTGFCKKHVDKTGSNNSFYGKTHSKETIDVIKGKLRDIMIEKWKDEEYSSKVKNGLKSDKNLKSHTSDSFREKQRRNAKKQMEDPEQINIRRESMKKNWATGKIEYHKNAHPNFSKDEVSFGEMLKKYLGDNSIFLERGFKIERTDMPKHYYCPDFRYKNFLIEFDGDFWHAKDFDDNEVVHNNITANEIRDIDLMKNKLYEQKGFTVIRVWRSDFISNKEECVKNIANILTS